MSKQTASASGNSAYKGGAIVLGILWLITAVLALSGILIKDDWALIVGIVIGLIGLPLAVWTFKNDPAAS